MKMTHKKYKTYTLVLLIVTVLALVITAAMLSLKRSAVAVQGEPVDSPEKPGTAYYTPKPASSQENSETEENSSGGEYLVTIYKGGIGVFQEGKSLPVLTSHAQVYLLPEEDIKLLRRGILAKDLAEAKRILEDYD